jgi:hypothetical protein
MADIRALADAINSQPSFGGVGSNALARALVGKNSLAAGGGVAPNALMQQPYPTSPDFYRAPMSPDQSYARNMAYAKPSPSGYLTTLSPSDELSFQAWVKQNNVPFDPSPASDYDMRGFWQAMKNGDPDVRTGINANDNQIHYTDKFKTPYHMSFSRESQWATPDAPAWNEADQLVLPSGRIVFDERALANARGR